jgi:hypothetical protein
LAVLLCGGCAVPQAAGADRAACEGVAQTGAETASDAPDFAAFGFPRVAAKQRFTPAQETTIAAEGLTLTLPADLYTEPLDFELLLGDEQAWQACAPSDQVVIAPYAYRATDPATGKRVGRFDKPVRAAVTDPRVVDPVSYWTTTPTSPPAVDVSSNKPAVTGTTAAVNNGSARFGWFFTILRS